MPARSCAQQIDLTIKPARPCAASPGLARACRVWVRVARYEGDAVMLAAGALHSPRLLRALEMSSLAGLRLSQRRLATSSI
jgi:hypothetical protein